MDYFDEYESHFYDDEENHYKKEKMEKEKMEKTYFKKKKELEDIIYNFFRDAVTIGEKEHKFIIELEEKYGMLLLAKALCKDLDRFVSLFGK